MLKLTDKNLRTVAAVDGDSPRLDSSGREEDGNMSIARTALSEGGQSIRSVHSARSLAAVVEKAREGITRSCSGAERLAAWGCGEGGRESSGSDHGRDAAVNDITVVTHKEDGGLRLGGKNSVSNLPYIRRNPAI